MPERVQNWWQHTSDETLPSFYNTNTPWSFISQICHAKLSGQDVILIICLWMQCLNNITKYIMLKISENECESKRKKFSVSSNSNLTQSEHIMWSVAYWSELQNRVNILSSQSLHTNYISVKSSKQHRYESASTYSFKHFKSSADWQGLFWNTDLDQYIGETNHIVSSKCDINDIQKIKVKISQHNCNDQISHRMHFI